MGETVLLAVPNISEGRDLETVAAVGEAYASAGARVLDVHSDPDHNRSVHTLAGAPGVLATALAAGAAVAIERIDLNEHVGSHPCVGAIDVAPVVYLDVGRRGAACVEALVAAYLLGELVPVLLYGALAGGRTRAELRRGGWMQLGERLASGEVRADFGPAQIHPSAGVVLVAARPPLVAFNVELAAPATVTEAKDIAAAIREGGTNGLPGLRAIGLELEERDGIAQVSMNIEDHLALPLARVIEAIRAHAPVAEAELVGLAPAAAFDGFPDDVPVRNRRTVEEALNAVG